MNMISTGSFLTETGASNKQSELVKKLTAAWEKKNSKTARAGGASLMALSLAACGGEDNTPFSQADVDAAKAEGVASVDITSDNTDVMLAQADYDAAIATATTSNDADIAAAAKAEALTSADGTIYATVDAAYTAGSNLSNSDAVTLALTSADGTVHASVDAAITSNDAAITTAAEASATASAEASLMAGSGFDTVAALLAAYTEATTTPAGTSAALTTSSDVPSLTNGDDTITATDTTYTSGDIIDGGNGTDVLTITAAAAAGVSAATSVTDVETVNVVLNSFTTETVDMNGVVGAAINVTNSQVGNVGDVTVNNINATSTLTLGDSLTGTATVTGGGTVNANKAATVGATLGADAGTITISGGDSTNTVNLAAASANANITTDKATISLAGTVTLDPESTNNKNVENLTLSGNGAAVTYDITDGNTAGNTLETLAITGDQNVTIIASAAALGGIDAAADYADTSTAGTTTITVDTNASVDLTYVTPDVLKYGVDNTNSATITVANGQSVEITGDVDNSATAALVIDSTNVTSGDETLTLEVQASQTNNGIDVSDFEIVNLNIDDDSAATTTAQTITIADLVGGASTDITITGSLDNVTLTAVTADNIVATNFAGVLNVATTANVDNITGGLGADVVDHDADSNFTFSGGAGNDALTISHALTNRTVTVDGGDGTDTIEITAVHAVGDRLSMSNVEIIDFNNNAGTYDVRDFTGQTLIATSTGGTNTSVTLSAANTTSFDLSGITGNDAELDFTIASTANNIANNFTGSQIKDTLTGGTGDDVINGEGGADVLAGAAGSDTINGGAGGDTINFIFETADADTLTGGDGNDTFASTTATAATASVVTITDFDAGTATTTKDILDISDTFLDGLTTTTDVVDTSAVTATTGTGGATIVHVTTDGGTIASAEVVVLSQTYADDTAALTGISTAGSDTITYGAALTDNDSFLIAYQTATGVNIAVATAGATNLTTSDGVDSVATLVTLTGVTAADLDTGDIGIIT